MKLEIIWFVSLLGLIEAKTIIEDIKERLNQSDQDPFQATYSRIIKVLNHPPSLPREVFVQDVRRPLAISEFSLQNIIKFKEAESPDLQQNTPQDEIKSKQNEVKTSSEEETETTTTTTTTKTTIEEDIVEEEVESTTEIVNRFEVESGISPHCLASLCG